MNLELIGETEILSESVCSYFCSFQKFIKSNRWEGIAIFIPISVVENSSSVILMKRVWSSSAASGGLSG